MSRRKNKGRSGPTDASPVADGSSEGSSADGLAEVIALPVEPEPEPTPPAAAALAGDPVVAESWDSTDAEIIPLVPDTGDEGRRPLGVKLLAVGVVASALIVGGAAYLLAKPFFNPDDFDGSGNGNVTVRIAPGASASDIGALLADAGVVASARSFVNITQDRSKTGSLHPGHYRLRKGMAAGAALDLLLAPGSKVVRRVTVPEGLRMSEALPRIASAAALPLATFQNVDDELLGLPPYARGPEGFLFPATYDVEPGSTAIDVLASMVERFTQAATKLDLDKRAAQVQMTPLQIVTLASIVQAEGGRDEDYPKIARVIYNRLNGGTPLQLDTTVLYAQDRRTLKVSEKDTTVRSPYNTYLRKGLPPGPIANPGEKALMAALHPAKGDWYWFVTTDPEHRITKFTDKESEFVRYREELNENLGTS